MIWLLLLTAARAAIHLRLVTGDAMGVSDAPKGALELAVAETIEFVVEFAPNVYPEVMRILKEPVPSTEHLINQVLPFLDTEAQPLYCLALGSHNYLPRLLARTDSCSRTPCPTEPSSPSLPGTSTPDSCSTVAHSIVYLRPLDPALAQEMDAWSAGCRSVLVRPLLKSEGTKRSVGLQGYGAELALKNTEYSVVNEETVMSVGVDGKTAEAEGTVNLKRIGAQIVEQAMSRHNSAQQLEELYRLVAFFPAHVEWLSKMKTTKETRQRMRQQAKHINAGQTVVSVNGIQFTDESLNTYAVLDLLRVDRTLLAGLRHLGVSTSASRKAMSIAFSEASSRFSIDLRPSSEDDVLWINNIEKDAKYASWGRSLQTLVQQGWPNQIRYVRRNLYDTIALVDPGSEPGLSLLQNVFFFHEAFAPLRFGLILVPRDTHGRQIAQSIVHLVSQKQIKAAATLVDTLLASPLSASAIDAAVSRAASKTGQRLNTFQQHMKDQDRVLIAMEQYRQSKGLVAASASVYLNGDLLASFQSLISKETYRDTVMPTMLSLQQHFQQLVYNKQLQDHNDLDLFKYANSYPRYNPVILRPQAERQYVTYSSTFEDQVRQLPRQCGSVSTVLLVRTSAYSEQGKHMVREAMQFAQSDPSTCVVWCVEPSAAQALVSATDAALEPMPVEGEEVPPLDGVPMDTVVFHGRIVSSPGLTSNDLKLLVSLESKEWLQNVQHAVPLSDPIDAMLTSMLIHDRYQSLGPSLVLPQSLFDPSFNVIEHVSPSALLHIDAVVDPLTNQGQEAVAFLYSLSISLPVSYSILLHPELRHEEMPITRFYQSLLNASISFDQGEIEHQSLVFRDEDLGKHARALLTVGMHTPEPWLVGSSSTDRDLDNLRLGEEHIRVEYELRHLTIAGQCTDRDTGRAAAGLQLETEADATIVMENLGYFQLKAYPRQWNVSIATNHASIYNGSLTVTIDSFLQPMQHVTVHQTGSTWMNLDTLLSAPAAETGLWSSLSSMFGSESSNEKDTIHIFSIASGHLYERFLRIMMYSVSKSTSSHVKFWLVGQFLSPTAKQEMPAFVEQLSSEFGRTISLELVEYRWPQWLRKQSEKQRTIWAYKILFLDVLFPIDLPRIIFVDADQIVRADLIELWNLDLQGAPYAYTPFCDSNPDTEAFRFWKQGYWKNHLGPSKRYHISALYVVDLVQFRKMRAGDKLRIMYDQLSRDKNSLSNLDQDLPNFAQHTVPIYSLPQEWLWCETWCSMSSLSSAKTIDLCNNPLTKEPKLDRARRIVSEWDEYDAIVSKRK